MHRDNDESTAHNSDPERDLAHSLATVELTEAEALLIVDALNGILFDESTWRLLPRSIAEAILLRSLDRKWDVDGERLISKLSDLRRDQALAIINAAERFWIAKGPPRKLIRHVGLV